MAERLLHEVHAENLAKLAKAMGWQKMATVPAGVRRLRTVMEPREI
jgi:hypothetical protein